MRYQKKFYNSLIFKEDRVHSRVNKNYQHLKNENKLSKLIVT